MTSRHGGMKTRGVSRCYSSVLPRSPRSTRPWPARPVRRRSPAGELWNDSLPGFVRVTNLSDQPWKIARMNKFTYAIALGAGLVLSLAAPNVQADPIVQSLTTADMSAAQFNSLFTPVNDRLDRNNYSFMNTGHGGCRGVAGVSGNRCGRRLVCLRVPVRREQRHRYIDRSTDQRQQRVDAVQRDAGCHEPDQVVPGTNLRHLCGHRRSNRPDQRAAGCSRHGVQTPSSIAWLPGTTTGSLTFQYLNPTTGTAHRSRAGATSGTIVVISTQPLAAASIREPAKPGAADGYPVACSPTAGPIEQVPAPEPATVLAWASVIAALAVGHRFRRARKVVVA